MEEQSLPEIISILEKLPQHIAQVIAACEDLEDIIEIVMDLGRQLELRYQDGLVIIPQVITERDLIYVIDSLEKFGPDDRVGIDHTLHRISKIDTRTGRTVGLTMRVGKNFPSSIDLIQEQVDTGKSLLILGKCGSGKTTLLRAIANYLSMRQRKKVVIIDTSNEIAGDGDIPHPAIGRARRMQVPTGRSQAEIMIRAVENHNPDVIIVDEISAGEEAQAAVTIAERGVQLIATAHGRELENLIKNKPLQDLVGGITKVTLSDETADRRNLASKTIQERVTEPPFTIIIEIVAYDEVNIYDDVLQAVDCLLSGGVCKPERRRRLDNTVRVLEKARLQMPSAEDHHQTRNNNHTPPVRSGSRSRQQKTNNGKAH